MSVDWVNTLAPNVPWQTAYAIVAVEARTYLSQCTTELSMIEIVEAIYPDATVRGMDGAAARQRLYKALRALADHSLGDCCHRAEARPGKGPMRNTMVRPIIWHAPRATISCPHCLGKGYIPA